MRLLVNESALCNLHFHIRYKLFKLFSSLYKNHIRFVMYSPCVSFVICVKMFSLDLCVNLVRVQLKFKY